MYAGNSSPALCIMVINSEEGRVWTGKTLCVSIARQRFLPYSFKYNQLWNDVRRALTNKNMNYAEYVEKSSKFLWENLVSCI